MTDTQSTPPKREYIQAQPSSEQINPDNIVNHISALHKLVSQDESHRLRDRLNPVTNTGPTVPPFEFLASSHGKDSPVEFFYGTEPEYLETLEKRLTAAYPSSFDVDRCTVDLLNKIIPTERYSPQDFVKELENGHLQFDPDAEGTAEDLTTDHTGKTDSKKADEDEDEAKSTDEGNLINDSQFTKSDDLSLDLERASDSTRPAEPESAVSSSGETGTLDPDDIDGFEMLRELDAGLLDLVALPEDIHTQQLEEEIDQPTWTPDGDILARPTLEHGSPVAVRWHGEGERKNDWMTTMRSSLTRGPTAVC
jgi:hypothetical protein